MARFLGDARDANVTFVDRIGVCCETLAAAGAQCDGFLQLSKQLLHDSYAYGRGWTGSGIDSGADSGPVAKLQAALFGDSPYLKVPAGLHNTVVRIVDADANTVMPIKRFCVHCSSHLFDALEDRSADDAVIDVLVPKRCNACDRHQAYFEPGEVCRAEFRTVRIPWDIYAEYSCSGAYKVGNPRRNLHINVTSTVEGNDITTFDVKKDAMLMVLPRVAQLQTSESRIVLDPFWVWFASNVGVGLLVWGVGFGSGFSMYHAYKLLRRGHFGSAAKCYLKAWLLQFVASNAVSFGVRRAVDGLEGRRFWHTSMDVCRWANNWRRDKALVLEDRDEDAIVQCATRLAVATAGTNAMRLVLAQEEHVLEHGGDVGTRVIREATQVDTSPELHQINSTQPAGHELHVQAPRVPVRINLEFSQLEKITWSPTWGASETRILHDGKVMQVAPLVGNAVIYDNDDLSTAIAALPLRLIPSKLPDFDSEAYHRLQHFVQVFKNKHIHQGTVVRSINELGIAEYLGGKRGPDEVRRYLTELAEKCEIKEAIDVITKLEVTAKPGKPPRLVFNEGAWRQVVALLVIAIFEHILFSERVCGPVSIKHKTRNQFCEEISKTMSNPPSAGGKPREVVGIEVDQTRFDSNETVRNVIDHSKAKRVGILLKELEIIDAIVSYIPRCLFEEDMGLKQVRKQEDSGKSVIKLRGKRTLDGLKDDTTYKLVINWLYRTSGNRRTSSGNFLEEIGSTLCTHTLNPWRLWEVDDVRKFDFIFIGRDGADLYFRFWAEGDDFAGQLDARAKAWQAEVIADYARLGLDVKLVYVEGTRKDPKRIEFCGIHFLCVNGRTVKGVYIPDVVRTLIVSGASVAKGEPVDKLTSIVSAFYMRAISTARFPAAAMYYEKLADSWLAKLQDVASSVELTGYDVKLISGQDKITFAGLKDILRDAYNEVPVSKDNLSRLVSASVGGNITPTMIGKWEAGACSVTPDMSAEEVYKFLPAPVVAKLRASFVVNAPAAAAAA